jgi:hypothetical protein
LWTLDSHQRTWGQPVRPLPLTLRIRRCGWGLEYRYEGQVANRALELIGKHLGMFRDAVDVSVKEDLASKQRSESLAATFTLEELERMMAVATRAAEARQQQRRDPATALPSDDQSAHVIDVAVESVPEPEQAEADTKPDIPEWMR